MQESEFHVDAVARVALSGWLESGIDGVVFWDQRPGHAGSMQWVPLMTQSVASQWPPALRQRLSHDVLLDRQEHFFIVHCVDEEYRVRKLARDEAERIVIANRLARAATGEGESASASSSSSPGPSSST